VRRRRGGLQEPREQRKQAREYEGDNHEVANGVLARHLVQAVNAVFVHIPNLENRI